ncbi:hypothetical protein [Amycolatopsis pigmentata]|uniref:Secreted protein n=1 Tax=Amycolatopsis pigmentata TaxID=450801 RepID=A0ABW5FPK6_9PSEU
MTAVLAGRRLQGLTALARTTPGILGTFTLALILVSLLAGALSVLGVTARARAVDDLAVRSGPLSVAAEEIYRSLSDADATANSAFLSGGLEPVETRQRYESGVAQAASALAFAIAAREPADITAPGSPLATIAQQLPVYTGLVETARANNRMGLPLGAAYQREASTLMRTRLLPAAQDLYRTEAAQVSADQERARQFPLAELLLGVFVLGVLGFVQRSVSLRTNRVFNTGLLTATAAAALSLVWMVVAGVAAGSAVDASRTAGSAQVDVLARARIATLSARADETLTLVARGTGQSAEAGYTESDRQLGALLDTAASLATDDVVREEIAAARADHATWVAAHGALRAADDSGDYGTAVADAIGDDPRTAGSAFDRLDANLRDAIERTRGAFAEEVTGARGALSGAVVVVSAMAAVTAVASTTGIWRRLRDYR